jgi:hypothetical protein
MADISPPGFSDLQVAIRADGADLVLEGITEGIATVRLVTGPETCLECIMPRETLEMILFASLSQTDGSLQKVQLIDPRETE